MVCKNVLIIEDEASVREAMRDVLELEGYTVVAAVDGANAIEILRRSKQPPSVILLDLMMPKMNGWEFLDFQKSDPRYSKIPVVVCSAYRESAKSIRPAAVISKPVQRTALLKTVEAFCA